MRLLVLILLVVFSGCSSRVPEYSPETFQADVTDLVSNHRYDAAIRYLERADPERQANFGDGTGYYAVGEDLIVLPGLPDTEYYDRDRDWMFPHTSDAIFHNEWQKAATRFAENYNRARNAK